ncbi:Flp family type IVb pilin [Nocardioides sp. YIM 123512]|uniref:Flp family type IVb pilin n=1 Tax=Nocardioides flavescens TaxID=2691959 RepID=A0A6L7EXZ8_9ACTN|nr:Flp family type IVb pilin [Nocardioides flavescens]
MSHRARRPGEFSRGRRPCSRAEDGASAVEYGLLVSGIAAVVVVVIMAFGGAIGSMFDDSCETIAEDQSIGSCN